MGGNTRTKQPNKTHPLNGRTKQNTEQFKNSAEQNTKPKKRPERFETRTPERSEHRTAFANTRTTFCNNADVDVDVDVGVGVGVGVDTDINVAESRSCCK